ncbi:hypothetical protein P152DRAFT_453700 [Eremomyces bilateralis CBS 781.70]|uniref:Uncharacterized protein n=1 Tax=Eremomyces bilateralis CBS 781.70 TaxID=1392243 RepID=A0A6G1GGG9_9PEZI|nr:uncharacterized protein P152DRAFT_453700 [Eremomyces bilateralis CBS 781.70]KAF1817092.1 hypothetical protein P152DRAFT_453700 [Eremomyces bilateralis CBS 781.70]
MVRKLPWSGGSEVSRRKTASARTSFNASKSRSDGASPSASAEYTDEYHRSKDARRQMSSSPIPAPPEEEFMIEGLDGDDAWIMVEDEFLSTAQLFTRHLHHAEYKRLKTRVSSQSSSVIQSITRHIVPGSTLGGESRKRNDAFAPKDRQQEAFGRMDDEGDSESEELWLRDSNLAGLMSGPKESSQELAALAGFRSRSRASARVPLDFSMGLSTKRRRDDKDDIVQLRSSHPTVQPESSTATKELRREDLSRREYRDLRRPPPVSTGGHNYTIPERSEAKYSSRAESSHPKYAGSGIEPHIKQEEGSLTAPERFAKRRAGMARKEKEKMVPKTGRGDEMPTFMF